jgi:hypothetical protein
VRRILLVLTVALVMAVVGLAMALPAFAQGPPVGGCPPGFDLVTVEFVLEGAGLEEPDPSMDRNADELTCLKLLDTGAGTRATWHDNVIPR